jgi:hypothetical protein
MLFAFDDYSAVTSFGADIVLSPEYSGLTILRVQDGSIQELVIDTTDPKLACGSAVDEGRGNMYTLLDSGEISVRRLLSP